MTENAKTLLFGVTAIVVAAVAILVTRPAALPAGANAGAGEMLYPDFTNPLGAASLEIFSYDRETATPNSFKVSLVNGRWAIPSHENYPTDAEKQLAGAAASVMDLKILQIKTDSSADHELYGVLDPDPSKGEIKSGSEGVGIKVALDAKTSQEIMRLIIGKEDPSQPGVRFVRRAGQDRVYMTKLDTSKLTTKFEDWIEPDLLKVNSWDITSIEFNNYSVNELATEKDDLIKQGDQLRLAYNDAATDKRWSLEGLQAGEELNETRLNEMRDALDELRIVDVRHKPAGLTAELKAEKEMMIDEVAYASLQSRGFFIIDGQLKSNEGDAIVGTKEGIEYMMRFGEIAADTTAAGTSAASTTPDADGKVKGQNRYVFITAGFNRELIEPPKLQPLPGETAPAQPAGEESTGAEATTQPEAAAETATEAATEATATEGEANACQAPAATDAIAETPPDDATESAAPAAGAKQPGDATTASPDQVALDAERQRIEAANQRAQELFDQKVKDGEAKAKELNERFADWYYIISDEIYRKIKVTRADIIKGADPLTGEKNTLEEFENLKNALPNAPDGAADGETESSPQSDPAAAP